MSYDRVEIIAQAFVTSLWTTINTLKRSTELGRGGFELGTEIEEDYQLIKSYLAETASPQQILPILRRKVAGTLRFMSQVAPRQEWQRDLGDIARETLTLTDETILGAFEMARPELTKLVAEYEGSRLQ